MVSTDDQSPHSLPFPVIRNDLDELLLALANLLDREFPKDLASIQGLQPFLLVVIKAVTNIFEAIRYIAADLPKDPGRKLEFGLAIGPLARSLADVIFTLVFMREDLASRVDWYHRGGWKELKEEFDRHQSEYASLPEWQEWLKRYEAGLERLRQNYGISEADAANPKGLPYWPTPGQMLRSGDLSKENKAFLQFLHDWVYRGLSAGTHISGAGIIHGHGFLLLKKDEGREEILSKLKSNGVFTATTLAVAICTEVNDVCSFGRDDKLSYLWSVLVKYWGEAKDLFERRYGSMLKTK